MPALVVLVSTDETRLQQIENLLSAAGYLVAPVSSFPSARELLRSVSPDLLVTDVQLGAFNGLHLAVYSRMHFPHLQVIVTNRGRDLGLGDEARRLGAAFLGDPLQDPAFLSRFEAIVRQHASSGPAIRQWPRKRASATVLARLAGTTARIFDLSYGGMRLAFGDERKVPDEFDITVLDAGITVHAQRVWTSSSPVSDEFWCGAEVLQYDGAPPAEWRDFVDAVN